jgi:tetratricopeptide (TPR) repeat protein
MMRRAAHVPVLLLFLLPYLFAQPSNDEFQKYVQQGDRALAEGRYSDAEQAFEKVRQLAPGIAEVHAKLGLIYFQQGEFLQAVPVLRQALKLKPGLPNAGTLLAMSLSELGRYSEALPGLEKAFRQSTDPAVKRMTGLQLERAYTGLQRDAKAVEVALELSRLYPEDPEVLYHTGRLFGNFAYITMQKLADVAPSSVWRHQAAGEAHQSQGDYDLALTEYREVLKLEPKRPGVHYRIGRVLQLRGQQTNTEPLEALKEFERELEIDPTNANAAYEIGEMLRKSGDYTKASRFFEQAVRYYPDFAEARLGYGATLLSLGKPDLALPQVQKAVELNPRDEVGFYRLSQIYRALGRTADQQKALAEYRKLRSNRPVRTVAKDLFSQRDVTKQEVDPGSPEQ